MTLDTKIDIFKPLEDSWLLERFSGFEIFKKYG